MDPINFVETGGQFGTKRRLPTLTIHSHDNGTFYVTDDTKNDRLIGAGMGAIAAVEKMYRPLCEYRTMPR